MRAIFVPTIKEGEKIFSITFRDWKHGIKYSEYNGIPVYVTGISKSCAAFAATSVIMSENIKEAVLTGICGAYRSSGLKVGDLVSIHRDFFADEAVFYKDRIDSLADKGFGLPVEGCSEFIGYSSLPIVNSNTVSFLDGEGEIAEMMSKSTGAHVENMEGASFGYVCNMLKVKVYQIRAVSNFCGKRNEQEWDIKKAFTNLKCFYENEFSF